MEGVGGGGEDSEKLIGGRGRGEKGIGGGGGVEEVRTCSRGARESERAGRSRGERKVWGGGRSNVEGGSLEEWRGGVGGLGGERVMGGG